MKHVFFRSIVWCPTRRQVSRCLLVGLSRESPLNLSIKYGSSVFPHNLYIGPRRSNNIVSRHCIEHGLLTFFGVVFYWCLPNPITSSGFTCIEPVQYTPILRLIFYYKSSFLTWDWSCIWSYFFLTRREVLIIFGQIIYSDVIILPYSGSEVVIWVHIYLFSCSQLYHRYT